MAFNRTGLSCADTRAVPGSRIWTYQTLDPITTVDASGYFNLALRELALGDKIEVTVVAGSIRQPTSSTRYVKVVNGLSASTVTTSNGVSAALMGSKTYDFGNLATLTRETTTVTVTGAKLGLHTARANMSISSGGLILWAWVSADDTVSVTAFNPTAGAIDLASATLYAFADPAPIS